MLPSYHYPLKFHFESLAYRLSTGNWAANICCICSACGLWHIIFNHSNATKHSTSTNYCNRGMSSMQGRYFIGFTQMTSSKINLTRDYYICSVYFFVVAILGWSLGRTHDFTWHLMWHFLFSFGTDLLLNADREEVYKLWSNL